MQNTLISRYVDFLLFIYTSELDYIEGIHSKELHYNKLNFHA